MTYLTEISRRSPKRSSNDCFEKANGFLSLTIRTIFHCLMENYPRLNVKVIRQSQHTTQMLKISRLETRKYPFSMSRLQRTSSTSIWKRMISESESTRLEITKIAIKLGDIPLAIEQSAAYLWETKDVITKFLPLYNEDRSTHQKLCNRIPKRNHTYHYSITTTWRMSFKCIKEEIKCPHEAMLLQLLAFLNPDFISLDFIRTGLRALNPGLNPRQNQIWKNYSDARAVFTN